MAITTMRSGAAGCKTGTFTAAANTDGLTNQNGPYKVIYLDPPWKYDVRHRRGSAENHYPTMSLEEMKALPVVDLADKDCAAFMWATSPLLPEAFSLMDAWGFTYKTVAFTWLKRYPKSPGWVLGLGYWTRQNAEFCLLGTRGRPQRVSKAVSAVLDDPIGRHSAKPQTARDRIVELMGDVPRVELFARTSTPGWDVWGNEVDCDVQLIASTMTTATTTELKAVIA